MEVRRECHFVGIFAYLVVAWGIVAPGQAHAGPSGVASPDGSAPILAQNDEPASGAPSDESASTDEPAQPSEPQQVGEEPQPSGDEPAAGPKNTANEPAKPVVAVTSPEQTEPQTQYGVGFHIRAIFVPSWLLNLFLDASTPLNSVALGGEFVRRKGDFDIIGSIDFGFYSPQDGNYLSKGGDPTTDTDYVHFDDLNAFSLAVHFIKHEQILPWMSFVWGGGVGISFVLGNIYRASNSGCTSDNVSDTSQCKPLGMDPNDPMAWINDPANRGEEADDSPENPKLYRETGVPPVLPLIHLLVGFNFRINDSFSVRVDGGFRNAFYAGATGHYFF